MNLDRVKGTRDFMPEEMLVREELFTTLIKIFKKYGFEPLETPCLERWETISEKSDVGGELIEETYNFKDKAGRRICLRPELTFPTARVIAMNPNLTMPFKRYQWGPVWRYGEIKTGRYREFYQMDIDTFGSESMLADAELIACAVECYKAIGLEFIIRINNRKLLNNIFEYISIPENKFSEAFRSIDKLDKIGFNGVKKELSNNGLSNETINKLLKVLSIKGDSEKVLKQAENLIGNKEGIKELKEIIYYLKKMKITTNYEIDLSLARGQGYYTGPIFEVNVKEYKVSFGGGGRYDKMIERFCNKKVPSTGFSFGIEPIMEVLKQKNKIKTSTKVFIAGLKDEAQEKVLEITANLRKQGINTENDLMNKNFKKQLDYANKGKIPYVIIIGPEEIKKEKYTLKNMKTGKQVIKNINEIIKIIRE